MKKKHKAILIILSAAIVLNIILNTLGNALQTEHYTLTSGKLTAPVRIVFISDLHNCTYGGSEQSAIWARIEEEQPDIVLFGGDMIDFQGGTSHALRLMERVSAQYPCAYAAGNHEGMRRDTEAFYADAEARGIPVLRGTSADLTANGQTLRICGVIDAINYPAQTEQCYQSLDADTYNILLLHQPEQFAEIKSQQNGEAGFDLVLSGHAHGGQWRIPGLVEQGFYAPDQGIFPEFTGGQRADGGTVQIVSRGLAKPLRMILIPRIFNRPEISSIEILPEVSGQDGAITSSHMQKQH